LRTITSRKSKNFYLLSKKYIALIPKYSGKSPQVIHHVKPHTGKNTDERSKHSVRILPVRAFISIESMRNNINKTLRIVDK
ncbi:MAG: hypothetical protein LBL24_06060, partial [Bacteroidales bacterium]|nr:hypothetical protein [Bacteroidales bacterium]